MANASENLLFTIGKMFFQPAFKEWRHRPREPNNGITGKLRASLGASFQNRRYLVISEPGNNRRNHHTDRNAARAQVFDRIET